MTTLNSSELASHIEALLFSEGDSLTFKKLCQLLACDETVLLAGLEALTVRLKGTGLSLILTETSAALAVAANAQSAITTARSKEQDREIGEAGLEVLAIILYEGPSTRAAIDFLRGVNSSSTIRTLLARGLVERTGNPEDGREYIYRPTVELLSHLGVSKIAELPDYATIMQELAGFKASVQPMHGTKPDTIT